MEPVTDEGVESNTSSAPLEQAGETQSPETSVSQDSSAPPEQPETSIPNDPVNPTAPPSKPNRKKLWIILAIIIVLLIAGACVFALTKQSKPSNANKQAVVVTKKTTVKTKPLSTTYTYLATPKQLDNLKWFTNLGDMFGYECVDGQTTNCTKPSVTESDITYTQVGTTDDGKPLIVAWLNGGEMTFGYFAIQTGSNSYTILGRISDLDNATDQSKAQLAQLQKYLASNVTVDTTTLPDEFNFPPSIAFNGMNLVQAYDHTPGGYFINSLSSIRGGFYNNASIDASALSLLGTDKSRSFYSVTISDKPLYQLKEVYGTVDKYFAKSYRVMNALTTDTAAAITWQDSSKNTAVYMSRNPGCGSASGYLVAKNISSNDLTEVGKTSDGQTVYQLSNDNALLQKEYTEDYAKGENLDKSELKNLSVADFQKIHGLIVVKNGMGDYAVYLRTDLFFGGGCAKPVVYLYPTQAQMVNVAVGANVTKSDPFYPVGGWKNVFAFPDSRLLYQGKGYNSLFWEGNGNGEYPIIRAGTVVPSSKAVSTIKTQLAAQGFNQTETADFLAYWQPKLPNSPYIRLTWLNTEQMNNLAPLSISPRPQTVIRTFLQFNGLQEPITLPAQHFSAPERNGFTVVEWGGLLR